MRKSTVDFAGDLRTIFEKFFFKNAIRVFKEIKYVEWYK